jgi:hypothetical protein
MKEPFSIEGRWHTEGESNPPFYGILRGSPEKGLRLEVKDIKERDLSALFDFLSHKELETETLTIQGYDSDNHPIRLFGCINEKGPIRCGLRTQEYYVHRAVKGLRAGNWKDLESTLFHFTFSMLSQWVNPLGRTGPKDSPLVDTKFQVDGLQFTIGTTRYGDGSQAVEEKWLELGFPDHALVADVYREYPQNICLLLSLLVGGLVGLDSFSFALQGEQSIRPDMQHEVLVKPGHGGEVKREIDSFHVRVSYEAVADTFPAMLKSWFAMLRNPDMRQVINLYTALTHHDLYIGARFLLIAQALEAYHTACNRYEGNRWPCEDFKAMLKRVRHGMAVDDRKKLYDAMGNANSKSFADRLMEVCNDSPAQIKEFIPDFSLFVKTVKDNRNAYTHHVGKQSHSRRLNEGALMPIALKMMGLLEILLLRDIGSPESAFDQIVRELTTGRIFHLGD